MRYGFAIDTQRCIGCHTCAVGCRMENNLPQGTWWNRILTDGGENMDTPAGVFPDITMSYVPVACQHCENPACVKVCPVGATYTDPETGVVRQDYEKCTMCWHRLADGEEPACIRLCPERARFWGDLDDPNSEVAKVIASREYKQLLPEKGTKPSVYYLV